MDAAERKTIELSRDAAILEWQAHGVVARARTGEAKRRAEQEADRALKRVIDLTRQIDPAKGKILASVFDAG